MKVFLSFTMFLLTSCAHAKNCESLDNMNEINICFEKQLVELETQIAAFITEHSTVLPKPNELIDAQSTWEKYRDLHCNNSARIFEGGTQYESAVQQCKISLSKSRIGALRSDYDIALSIIKTGSP